MTTPRAWHADAPDRRCAPGRPRHHPPAPRRRLRLGPAAILLLAATRALDAAPPPRLVVPLSVRAPGAGGRGPAPMAASVPLPAGRLREPQSVWGEVDGRPVPSQATALERWPDGSVRWLRVDVLAALADDGGATLTLRAGSPPRLADAPRLRLERAGGEVTIDTGVLRVALGTAGALTGPVRAGGSSLLEQIPLPVLQVGERRLTPALDGSPVVEVEGPLRAEVLLRGRYAGGLALEARLAAFAGQRWFRLQLTVINRADDPWASIRALALEVPGRWDGGEAGVDGRTHTLEARDVPSELRQPDAQHVLLDGEPAGSAADGWLRARGPAAALTVVRRWFHEEYPQAFRLARDRAAVDLVAGADAPVPLGRGAAKTFELWLALEPPDAAGDPAGLAAALRAAPIALPPARWIVASGALPQSLEPEAAGAAAFLQRLDGAARRYAARARIERWDDGEAVDCAARPTERERRGFHGVLNWGDWNFPGYRDKVKGCDAWGNLEYDLTQVFGLAWAATNDPAYRQAFEASARHYRDVDVIHHDPQHPERVGLNHPHKPRHHAVEAKQSVDLGHTWVEGLVTHWRLTGEVRSREAAVRMADALAARLGKAGNPRHFGWPMIALAAVAGSTNDARHREAALRFAAAAREAFAPTPAAADWKIGIQADGLAAVDALGGDPAVRRWLTAYADAFVAERDRFADPRYALPLGYLGAATGDRRYAAAALAVAGALQIGDWGKTLASDARIGFRLLGPLAARADGAGVAPPSDEPASPHATPPGRAATGPRAPAGPPPTWGLPSPRGPGAPPPASERAPQRR